MGKGADLWDNAALIKSFDAAISSYKEMQGAGIIRNAHCEDKNEINSFESDYVLTDVDEGGNQLELKVNDCDVENSIKETCASSFSSPDAANVLFTQETCISSNLPGSEFNTHMSDHPSVKLKVDGDSDHQIPDYNELLRQYYDLEQKKQNISEQLWQGNYWNYQTPQVPGSTSQVQQAAACSVSKPGPNNPCSLCTCHCLNASLKSITDCPMSSMLSGGHACCPNLMLCCSGSQFQQEAGDAYSEKSGKCSMVTSFPKDSMEHSVRSADNAVKEGIRPLEDWRTCLSYDRHQSYSNYMKNQDGGNGRSSMFEGRDLCSAGPKTDLTTVLNAWYRAGYHTGRYLLEQEPVKRKSIPRDTGNS